MLKLTRLDHRIVAINPDHIAWIEATPDTTLCLLGDRKIIVRESLDEVVDRFIACKARMGGSHLGVQIPTGSSTSRRPPSPSGRPSSYPAPRVSAYPPPAPRIVDEDGGY